MHCVMPALIILLLTKTKMFKMAGLVPVVEHFTER